MNSGEREPKSQKNIDNDLVVEVPKDATFADLFSAIDALEEEKGLGEVHFEEELWDNFDNDLVESVLAFREDKQELAAETKITSFFKKHGYSRSGITDLLPIKFKKSETKAPQKK